MEDDHQAVRNLLNEENNDDKDIPLIVIEKKLVVTYEWMVDNQEPNNEERTKMTTGIFNNDGDFLKKQFSTWESARLAIRKRDFFNARYYESAWNFLVQIRIPPWDMLGTLIEDPKVPLAIIKSVLDTHMSMGQNIDCEYCQHSHARSDVKCKRLAEWITFKTSPNFGTVVWINSLMMLRAMHLIKLRRVEPLTTYLERSDLLDAATGMKPLLAVPPSSTTTKNGGRLISLLNSFVSHFSSSSVTPLPTHKP